MQSIVETSSLTAMNEPHELNIETKAQLQVQYIRLGAAKSGSTKGTTVLARHFMRSHG